ncbi:MAG: SagB/ThcOx family dehydrogenase [Deltaproteobacteria bacterium]|nr:SagB/ThcOx family dehydrogenase [Deltaproteobacteria bacterium]
MNLTKIEHFSKVSFFENENTSYVRHKMTGHYLDWKNQPGVFKHYPGIDPVLLPQNVHPPEKMLSALIKGTAVSAPLRAVSIEDISLILRLTCTLTAKARHAGGDFYYRSVASAGALYPSEIYVATQSINNLDDGLYHFSIAHHSLSLLRKGDITAPILTFFLSAIFFRSAWKYRERSYRYHLLDTGHLIENLTLALKALQLCPALSFDFNDSEVNRLLGLDETKEVCLAVCHINGTQAYEDKETEKITELQDNIKNASRVAEKETDYPAVHAIHKAGTAVISQPESKPGMIHELGLAADKGTRIYPPDPWPETLNYAETVSHRRSKRNFVRQPISQGCLTALLDGLCSDQNQSMRTGFLAGNAEGFDPGIYLLDTSSSLTAMVDSGLFIDRMAHICLDQAWLANAAVHFLFMSNLDFVDSIWGPRGYRYAMMTAGRLGERIYLMATAMGLGCCGIGAFYDMEAAELLCLNNHSRLLYLVAVGQVKSVKAFA